jgi:hypothetical protein
MTLKYFLKRRHALLSDENEAARRNMLARRLRPYWVRIEVISGAQTLTRAADCAMKPAP